ncbi:Sulfoxide reductase heme-binding subunit YedZ [Planctomycetes bacterium LzC2]|uniref:Protein-methionine-sulfoxide reductase heme-binding subunit MsrQ n=1 Tax=Alienimonas chondri TaxID=2681879 RepID=A0ABX1VBD5_9PLAN|nr:Sulfoxide reductase heme-binding subunit YedZ [Alienimonas chondri]
MFDAKFLKLLATLNGLVPLALLIWDATRGNLGGDPVNAALHTSGLTSLIFLLLSLAVTPIRLLTGWNAVIAVRRALGLFAFLYAIVHVVVYVVWERAGILSSVWDELLARRYLQVGAVALVAMVPLAVTSTGGMIRRIGPVWWKRLHRLAYLSAAAGVLHFYMQVKSDVRLPLAFAAVLGLLLGFRAIKHYRELKIAADAATVPATVAATAKSKHWRGPLKVARIFEETPDVKTFRLIAPDGGDLPFDYEAGQYLTVSLPVQVPGEGGVDQPATLRRPYSISSSPTRRGFCELTVKRDPNGLGSQALHDTVAEGDLLTVAGPAGKFLFAPDPTAAGVVLIAGGVGVTPILSLLRSLTDRSWPGEIYVANVQKTRADRIAEAELRSLAARFPNVHLLTTLTREDADGDDVAAGRLTAERLAEFVPNLSDLPVYLCGPEPMMAATRDLLTSQGVPPERITVEEFVAGAPPQHSEAHEGDAPVESAAIAFSRSNLTAAVPGETTVLEAAESVGAAIPYECRSGICGQCKVRCTEGAVTMAHRDALSQKEEQADYILACQARATTASLTIEA